MFAPQAPPRPKTRHTCALAGGGPPPSAQPWVLAQNASGFAYACGATVIAPSVALVSAMCVAPAVAYAAVNVTAAGPWAPASAMYLAAAGPAALNVSSYAAHPSAGAYLAAVLAGRAPLLGANVTDLGVLVINGTFAAPPLAPDASDLLANGSYWGGLLSPAAASALLAPSWPQATCDAYTGGARRGGMTCVGTMPTLPVGSQGSPLLLGGSGILAGVYSSMSAWLAANSTYDNEPVLAFTRVAPALPWIRSVLPAGTSLASAPAPPGFLCSS
jgi:hypothetical protein